MIPVQQPHDLVCVFSHYTFIVFLPEVYHNSYDAHVLKRRAVLTDFTVNRIDFVLQSGLLFELDPSSSLMTLALNCLDDFDHSLDFVSSTLAKVGVSSARNKSSAMEPLSFFFSARTLN